MALTIDQQFIEYIVKTLVNKPEAVKIERTTDDRGVLLSLSVDPEDLGRVIGREGRTAQALRSLLRALGMKNDARYNLKIVSDDEGGERPVSAPAAEEVSEEADESVEEATEVVEDEAVENSSESNELAEKTRQELADLDDLDI
ncbi:KH domain-containing protein [Candidatus Saccharibacteria bacterium]|nr:KH domain-containing protein [Candidatus Saccharibacteria bacterium]